MTNEKEESGISIKFLENGSVLFEHRYIGEVHPIQVIAVCEYLILESKQKIVDFMQRVKTQEMEKPPKIFVPESKLTKPS